MNELEIKINFFEWMTLKTYIQNLSMTIWYEMIIFILKTAQWSSNDTFYNSF